MTSDPDVCAAGLAEEGIAGSTEQGVRPVVARLEIPVDPAMLSVLFERG
jgi:hypothetical protein